MTPDFASTNPGSHAATAWHTLDLEHALARLESDRYQGLTHAEVKARQKVYGLNELEERGGRSTFRILLDQFTNIMLLMLMAVAVVSAILDIRNDNFPKDAIAIFLIVVLNGILGYLQESRAEKALAALKQLSAPTVRVLRDGKVSEVEAKYLVPGDIMLLDAGRQISADGLLLEASNLQVRESSLTGEAEAVMKQTTQPLDAEASLGDRTNMVFQGTEVINGRGTVLITSTGMKTELGRIATMLQDVEADPTPLQLRMTQLGNVLVGSSLVLVALVVVGGVLYAGRDAFEDLLEVSLSMAVAVVPEGLPAVITVTLALGTQRMVKRHALIRKLPAVETLGSVTTICSDKTGTLTQNKMVVQQVELMGESGSIELTVTGDGYEPVGECRQGDRAIAPQDFPALQALMAACVLCNDAILQEQSEGWSILGDPTEGALLTLAGKIQFEQSTWTEQFPRQVEFPFTSERKRMSVVVPTQGRYGNRDVPHLSTVLNTDCPSVLFCKGSPELILEQCAQVQLGDRPQPLTDDLRQHILDQNNQLAGRGLRVLGFAYRPLDDIPPERSEQTAEQSLIWLGLVGMLDAPRPEVREAVKRCRQAGIRPIMITGDHQLTARAIAEDLGIAEPGTLVLTGRELEHLDTQELEAHVKRVSVYARVSPEHKLRIVRALQRQGKIVAMTGDGVNDAPALKQANIGIAMGITGTDVSKEASDMVLLDDNFASIVAATEEGRVVYSNIRRFVKYVLGSNIGEVLTIAASPILVPGGGVPLIPLQILWMNLVTDGLPALALAVEPAEPNVMQRPPHDPQENIFARGLGSYMLRIGVVFAIITITLMVFSFHFTMREGHPERWKTMVFTMLCLSQMGHAIAVRSSSRLTIEMNPFSNVYVWGAVLVTTVLQLMLIYVEPLRLFFGTQVLNATELAICFGFSTLLFVWVELEKLFIRWYRSGKG